MRKKITNSNDWKDIKSEENFKSELDEFAVYLKNKCEFISEKDPISALTELKNLEFDINQKVSELKGAFKENVIAPSGYEHIYHVSKREKI